ncbi:hypothetical protein LVB87_11400 [Lysobacter sp. KIS68-7]|uniref:hypothetical protein n=1 Tax=Lysobacter sp. KIS68-7 TaxID=2904252 RepID=UPI001E382E2C|nr:hypothetical protein [Lysobacter sp. KIS68-7]UHQ18787.1 hypothetical protein LVB87_11400 [Lysobacter sp. KIS68-7]
MKSGEHFSRFLMAVAVAIGLLAALPASASTYYFCYLQNAYGDEGYYYTPIMETSEDFDETSTGFKFDEWRSRNGIPLNDIGGGISTGCYTSQRLDVVRRDHTAYPTRHPGAQLIDWPEPPVASEPVEDPPATDSLVIETPKEVGLTPEMIAANALAAERVRAAEAARNKAELARKDAELEVKVRESKERARRRGRMQ